MWDRTQKATRDARDFAAQHGLAFHGDAPAPLPSAFDQHPLTATRRDACVSGEWRGRVVQRFLVDGVSVELMALPRPLPRLQVVPAGMPRGAMEVGGVVCTTGDAAFDRAFTVYADERDFASTLLDAQVREALLHPAFAGRALTIDADVMYLWTAALAPWEEARTRFEILSVLIARIPLAVWERFDRSGRVVPAADANAWVPEAIEPEASQWTYVAVEAEVQQPAHPAAAAEPTWATAPLAEAPATFMPAPVEPAPEQYAFAVAPIQPR